jgi:hypothetical protein
MMGNDIEDARGSRTTGGISGFAMDPTLFSPHSPHALFLSFVSSFEEGRKFHAINVLIRLPFSSEQVQHVRLQCAVAALELSSRNRFPTPLLERF